MQGRRLERMVGRLLQLKFQARNNVGQTRAMQVGFGERGLRVPWREERGEAFLYLDMLLVAKITGMRSSQLGAMRAPGGFIGFSLESKIRPRIMDLRTSNHGTDRCGACGTCAGKGKKPALSQPEEEEPRRTCLQRREPVLGVAGHPPSRRGEPAGLQCPAPQGGQAAEEGAPVASAI